jgi:hypothetical protein
MGAQKEHRAAFARMAKSLSQNCFPVCRHVPSPAALDKGLGFVAG